MYAGKERACPKQRQSAYRPSNTTEPTGSPVSDAPIENQTGGRTDLVGREPRWEKERRWQETGNVEAVHIVQGWRWEGKRGKGEGKRRWV